MNTATLNSSNNLKINESKRISILILVLFLVLQFANVYMSWGVLVLYAVYMILVKNKKIVLDMPGLSFYFLIIVEGLFIGLIGNSTSLNGYWPYLRDLIRFSSIALVWFVFRTFSNDRLITKKAFYRTFYIFCIICSIAQTVRFVLTLSPNFNLYNLRMTVVINEGVLALGTYFSFFKPQELSNEFYIGKIADKVFATLIVAISLLTFSRTVYLLIICLLLFSVKNFKKLISVFIVATILVLVLYNVFPDISQEFFKKMLSSFGEISTDYTWDNSAIVNNWRGYEIYNFTERFNSSRFLFKLFGGGFGTTLDVGVEYAHIVTGEDTLGYLHNGFLTTILKNGILGLLFLVAFFFALLLKVLKYKDYRERRMLLGMLVGIVITSFFTISVLWSGNDVFLLCVFVYILSDKKGGKGA